MLDASFKLRRRPRRSSRRLFQVVAAIYGVASDTGSIVSVCCTGVTKACAA